MTKVIKEKMNCDIILTFDKIYGGETQAFLNFDLEVRDSDTDLNEFILEKLFKMIDRKISSKNFSLLLLLSVTVNKLKSIFEISSLF